MKISTLATNILNTGKKTNGNRNTGLRKTRDPNKIGIPVLKIAGKVLQPAILCWFFCFPTHKIPITKAKVTPIPPKLAKPL